MSVIFFVGFALILEAKEHRFLQHFPSNHKSIHSQSEMQQDLVSFTGI